MHPRIGKRSQYNLTGRKKPESKAVEFIVRNTKKSITLKQEYLYLEDVKKAMNIYHLEQNFQLKRWFLEKLRTEADRDRLISSLERSMEEIRHQLQKNFKVNV